MSDSGITWGFFLDKLSARESISLATNQAQQLAWGAGPAGVLLLKPLNFMNNSGLQVQGFIKHQKIDPPEILVLHDELDFPCGKARFKFAGSEGGHNGLRSISRYLGCRDYWRLRIGIGRPPPGVAVLDHVLQRPRPSEQLKFAALSLPLLNAVREFVWGEQKHAMRALHNHRSPL